jgi:catechol 2,3-dioxygenase-like lactoylglutathione lyase family enzyme
MKLRTGDPWMPAPAYGRSLHGLTLNLLVRDIATALPFHREVLGAEVIYSDPDFAVLRHWEAEWMLHADHTYLAHPLHPTLAGAEARGVGAELRLHGRDPDKAEAAARQLGYPVLAGSADKPHGLREVYLLDADGYLWVPDVPRPK